MRLSPFWSSFAFSSLYEPLSCNSICTHCNIHCILRSGNGCDGAAGECVGRWEKNIFWDIRQECPTGLNEILTTGSSVSIMFSGATVIVNMLLYLVYKVHG